MRNKKTLIITIVSILLLSVVAVTYAYFASGVNNENPSRVSVQAGNMEMTLTNGSGDITQVLQPGSAPIEYTFTIENNGTYNVFAKVSWLDLINTYTQGSLVYKLYSSETDGVFDNTPVIEGDVPVSAYANKYVLADKLLIKANSTNNKVTYFKLTIELVDLPNVYQVVDENTQFYTRFTLDVGQPINEIQITRNITSSDSSASVINTATGRAINTADFKFLNDIETVQLATEDVMVKFPKFYYSRNVTNNIETIYLSDYQTENATNIHPAFLRTNGTDNEAVVDYIYLAAYESTVVDNVPTSKAGQTTTTGRTIDTWRTSIGAKGTGWQMMDASAYSMIQMLAIANNGTVNLNEKNYFGLNSIVGNYWEFVDGLVVAGQTAYVETDERNYSQYNNYPGTMAVYKGANDTWITRTTYDSNYPWLMLPAAASKAENKNTYYGDQLFVGGSTTSTNKETVTVGGHKSDGDKSGLFGYVYNDGKLTEGGSGFYTARMLFVPFDETVEPISASNWKQAFNYTDDGTKASGINTYTSSTTYTYKYIDSSNNVIVGDTITEDNTLRYWLHIPFNYKSSKSYPLIVYLHGSGGALFLQQTEHGSLARSIPYTDFASAPTYALRQLSGVNTESNTNIKSILYEDGTIKASEAFGGSWDSNFVSAWFNKVKTDPSYDAFFIFPQINDELWFENRAKYTINSQEVRALDVHNSYKASYGETLQSSKGSYNHSYLASELSPNVWFQLLVSLQETLISEYNIDRDRQYVVGASLGGVGTYDLISHYPDRYAAAVSVAAPGADVSSENVSRLLNTNVLAYHGTNDSWVSSAPSERFVSALNNAGGNAEIICFNYLKTIQSFE